MKQRLPVLISIFLIWVSQAGLMAQSGAVGTMTLNRGVVKVRRALVDQLYRTTGQEIPVMNLDEIQTGKDSNVTIDLKAREDKLELYSQSFFKIDDVSEESSQVSMSIGKARFKIKKGFKPKKPRIKGRKRFRVRTANAIVGVKGTEFVMAAGTDVTSILTIEGSVDVASVAAPEIEVEVGENQASQIKQTSTPTAPVSVPPDVKETILTADTPNAFNNVTFGEAVTPSGVNQESKKESSSEEKSSAQKEETKTGSDAGSGDQQNSQTGSGDGSGGEESPAGGGEETSGGLLFGAETGDEGTFDTGDSGAGLGGDAINLETIETAELDEIEVEEPEIDPADILDLDAIIEDVEDNTNEIQEEIEEIQEEILENQLQEIKIRIRHR